MIFHPTSKGNFPPKESPKDPWSQQKQSIKRAPCIFRLTTDIASGGSRRDSRDRFARGKRSLHCRSFVAERTVQIALMHCLCLTRRRKSRRPPNETYSVKVAARWLESRRQGVAANGTTPARWRRR